MVATFYTAQKSRTDGRQMFAVTFRHPRRTDSRGKPGLKVRRGLGTADEAEADGYIAEFNALLSEERYWNLAARDEAARRFSPLVVNAFYAGLEVAADAADQTRDDVIPLPGREQGYSSIILVGTTGAGKTTLLRHLIGAHPRRDRFPSTSTGKTTVADLEVVTCDGPYDGVVTFLSERAVRGYLQECVTAACFAARAGGDDTAVARALLQHAEQRLRLHYVLGELPSTGGDADEDWGFEQDAEDEANADEAREDIPTDLERDENAKRIAAWVHRVRTLVGTKGTEIASTLECDWDELNSGELEAAEAMLALELESSDEHSEIVIDILDQILARFDRINDGRLTKTTTGWPTKWEITSGDRSAFLRAMRWFASNYAPRYGRLLTPLVQGMRVRGPFYPALDGAQPKLVLIDGQGLGHTPDSAATVTTNITGRFAAVDVILLVDNAQQPMQAAPLAVVRAVATGGFQAKLAIAFTHFDQVLGPNLPTAGAKRDHVVGAARNVLNTLRYEIGPTLVRSLEQGLDDRCFMLGWLNMAPDNLSPKVREQLSALLRFFEDAIVPAAPIPAIAVYDPSSLLFAVQSATREFQSAWHARLGFKLQQGVSKAHWSSVKALNRRIADNTASEYGSLMPVADLLKHLSEEISRFLDQPLRWEGDAVNPAERERAIDAIRRAVSAALHRFAAQRVIQERRGDWVRAYEHNGRGSTLTRARDIRSIYEDAAPVPGVIATQHTNAFLGCIRGMVHEAIQASGGSIPEAVRAPA